MSKQLDKQSLQSIGRYILEGLSESEACVLSDIKKSDLDELKERNEEVRDFIEKSKVSFKYEHLKEMQTKKSDKTSQWLLERLRPEDFNTTSRSKNNTTINVVGTIIQQIQQDDTNRLVTNRQDRFIEESESDKDNTERTVLELLN